MCQPTNARHGSSLAHGAAHSDDHHRWSRRSFLSTLGLAAGGSLMLGQTPVQAFAATPHAGTMSSAMTDRVLVLIQLAGGNDGLNTLVPIESDTYYRRRPLVSIPSVGTLPLNATLGFHRALAPLLPLYQEGEMAILQGVGYPNQDLSHFRSTDIWLTGTDTQTYANDGWVGRTLEEGFGTQVADLSHPLAVQLGHVSPLLVQGFSRNTGMLMNNPDLFRRLAQFGKAFDETDVPEAAYGQEIAFMRTMANDAYRYAGAIQRASDAGRNHVGYPTDSLLAENLAIVAKLIKGNLGARIYHLVLGGFDTHSNQKDWHATLLRYLAEGVAAFQQDLKAGGRAHQVLTMTFSEFGRRVEENGSRGTDHGTSAPLFLFGPTAKGGLYGQTPNLDDLDDFGNMKYQTNFRGVYATVLQDWFGFPEATTTALLGEAFPSLGFVAQPTATQAERTTPPAAARLHTNYPNPFHDQTTIRYTLPQASPIELHVYDVQGRLVHTLAEGLQAAGTHQVVFQAGHLPSGSYLCRLTLPGGQQRSLMMTLIR